ncbi:MAG TPA: hypothetical protein VMS17_01605 [Gemmataceae bacterium]|nr:hypothetical protein [Gemmataceae bacterium]
MHEQWEYKTLARRWFTSGFFDEAGVVYDPLSDEMLNRLGKQGWEVCGYHWLGFVGPTLILKRRLGD